MKEQEYKAKFFAQYWGQISYRINDSEPRIWNGLYAIDDEYLLLTPLSDITEEDAKEVNIDSAKAFHEYYDNCRDLSEMLDVGSIDYLRSKGCALPYLNYSVEDLIKLGWIKLKEK